MREVAASNAEYFAHNIIAMETIHKKYVNRNTFRRLSINNFQWDVFAESKKGDLQILTAIRRREAERFNEELSIDSNTVTSDLAELEDIVIED